MNNPQQPEQIRKRVMSATQELSQELGDDFLKQAKIRYISSQIDDLQAEIAEANSDDKKCKEARISMEERLIYYRISGVDKKMARLEKLRRSLVYWESGKNGQNNLSWNDIETARQVPFSAILHINKKGFAFCLFHNDKRVPNLYTRYNRYAHCFVCFWSGDVIRLIMDRDKISFPEAVKFLIRGG